MKAILLCLVYFIALSVYGQKPVIDSTVFGKWPEVRNAQLSNNGKYYSYEIDNQPVGSSTSMVGSTDGKWRQILIGVKGIQFTSDSKKAVYTISKDSVCVFSLEKRKAMYIKGITSSNLIHIESRDFLIYQTKLKPDSMVFVDLISAKHYDFGSVQRYWFVKGDQLIVLRAEGVLGNPQYSLYLYTLGTMTHQLVWQGTKVNAVLTDAEAKQLAFSVDDSLTPGSQQIYYYTKGQNRATLLIDAQALGSKAPLLISGLGRFSSKGERLEFNMERPVPKEDNSKKPVDVVIWSYTDPKLQSERILQKKQTSSLLGIMDLITKKVKFLQEDNEHIVSKNDAYILFQQDNERGASTETNWNVKSMSNPWVDLVSVETGIRIRVNAGVPNGYNLSPEGKYVVYFDAENNNYMSYDVSSGSIKNITAGTNVQWYVGDRGGKANGLFECAWWADKDEYIVLYDQFDLWKVDPSGVKAPQNLTNGYGKRNNIHFRLGIGSESLILDGKHNILLSAFNKTTKENGFYHLNLNVASDPQKLVMGPYAFFLPNGINRFGSPPVKAQHAEKYIVRRMTASSSPNYFFTEDFKCFKAISNVYPEKDYNWIRSELITWTALDGASSRGILYKPEDFDSTKKYPVIFYCYEKLSDGLHTFLVPEKSMSNINVAWYVSNGYLVFMPDIYYKMGMPMQGAYDHLVTAAHKIAALSYVNPQKMALHGFSFGGLETNYLITQSKIFAAACSNSGVMDLVSHSGSIGGDGSSLRHFVEIGQTRIGATLWERPDLYIRQSVVFQADKVSTPLLLMHTFDDGATPFSQAIEFFTALRRLGKKVWMLQYPGNHAVVSQSEADDFTLRMAQFFDFYLKDKPAPKWMLENFTGTAKDIIGGLKLDTMGRIPGPGLLSPEDERKVENLSKIPLEVKLKNMREK